MAESAITDCLIYLRAEGLGVKVELGRDVEGAESADGTVILSSPHVSVPATVGRADSYRKSDGETAPLLPVIRRLVGLSADG